MKIIIVGGGKVGCTLAKHLVTENHDVVLIDIDPSKVQDTAEMLDIIVVCGNGACLAVLKEAGVESADLLIAVTGFDELNMLCCLTAKKAGARNTFARIRNPEYAEQIPLLKNDLGLSVTINPELVCASEISRLLRFPAAMKISTFSKGRVEMSTVQVSEGSILDGMQLMNMKKKFSSNVLISTVERNNEVFIPSGMFTLKAGDKISIMAQPAQAADFYHTAGIFTSKIKNVLIVGGSRVAIYLAKQLSMLKMSVKIIEHDRAKCEKLNELLPGATIIYGDGSDKQLLKEEGLDKTDAFVALTDIDEVNIIMSLYAKNRNVPKVITKVDNIQFTEVVKELEVGTIVSPKDVSADIMTTHVRGMQNTIASSDIETLYKLNDDRVEAMEFIVKDYSEDFVGKKLMNLKLKSNTLITSIIRGSHVIVPGGQDTIEIGDSVIVVTAVSKFDDLTDILRK